MPATKRAFLNKSLTALGAVVAVSVAVVAGNPAVASHVTRHQAPAFGNNNSWMWDSPYQSATVVKRPTAANPRSATRSRHNSWMRDRPYPPATVVTRPRAANPHSATQSRYNAWKRDRRFQ